MTGWEAGFLLCLAKFKSILLKAQSIFIKNTAGSPARRSTMCCGNNEAGFAGRNPYAAQIRRTGIPLSFPPARCGIPS